MNNRHLLFLVGFLILAGTSLFLYKTLSLNFPLFPEKTVSVWEIEAKISFSAKNKPVKISFLIPKNTRLQTITNENFISRGYGLTTSLEGSNKKAVWSIRKAKGRQVLFYRATVQKKPDADLHEDLSPTVSTDDEKLEGPMAEAATAIYEEILSKSADLETLVSELLNLINNPGQNDSISLFLGKKPSPTQKIRAAVAVLKHAGIPARIVNGIELKELDRNAKFIQWLQVYNGKVWKAFFADTGTGPLPSSYLTWWRGTSHLLEVSGVENVDAHISVSLNKQAALLGAYERGQTVAPRLIEFLLASLPLEVQAVYHVLLLIPVGAFILLLLRNLVGIKTFGTFMPVLIALSFRETQLFWGIVLFSMILAMGLSVRFYLERLKLLLVPRLAAVLIVVVLLMAFVSVISFKLGIHQGLSVALFPMVIVTMTIERMSIVWDERGAMEALQQAVGSLVAASIAYLIMNIPMLNHLVFVFPELLLILLAITILLGRYSGYRLLELYRFKALMK